MSLTRDRRERLRARAGDRCEYCQLPQQASVLPHQVDHIIANQHRGPNDNNDDDDNLCLCCIRCNLHKGPNLASLDPASGDVVVLFNPRAQRWSDHFVLETSGRVVGLTPQGRATAELLRMNDLDRMTLRLVLFAS